MPYNRIAVLGHRGWASSAIVDALRESGAPIRILYRHGSDVSNLPVNVERVQLDLDSQEQLVTALKDIDIVISLVGLEGVERQRALLEAIPHTDVKLFSPSDLAARYDEEGLSIPAVAAKRELENAAVHAGIPITVILTGNFAEFALATPALGIDERKNTITYTGNSASEPLNLCTRRYVAAAYASIFAKTPISDLQGRIIGLSEIRPTGRDIAYAMAQKEGTHPTEFRETLERVAVAFKRTMDEGSPFALMWYCRKIWGTGQQSQMVGEDIWELTGYEKTSLEDLVVNGQLESYRRYPPPVQQAMTAELSL